jgi:hypothetical protein
VPIGVTFFQGIVLESVTHHSGLSVTFLSSSYLLVLNHRQGHRYRAKAQATAGVFLDHHLKAEEGHPRKCIANHR